MVARWPPLGRSWWPRTVRANQHSASWRLSQLLFGGRYISGRAPRSTSQPRTLSRSSRTWPPRVSQACFCIALRRSSVVGESFGSTGSFTPSRVPLRSGGPHRGDEICPLRKSNILSGFGACAGESQRIDNLACAGQDLGRRSLDPVVGDRKFWTARRTSGNWLLCSISWRSGAGICAEACSVIVPRPSFTGWSSRRVQGSGPAYSRRAGRTPRGWL